MSILTVPARSNCWAWAMKSRIFACSPAPRSVSETLAHGLVVSANCRSVSDFT
ncbi:hypothetical protein ACWDTT_35775 [Streptosporangium sandarakinum]